MVNYSLKKHEGLRNDTQAVSESDSRRLMAVDAAEPNIGGSSVFRDKLQQYHSRMGKERPAPKKPFNPSNFPAK